MQSSVVLIVEDDNDINNMLADLLSSSDYEVASAFSGTEALLCMEKNHYDLVLLDLMLPGMSGEKVLERICSDFHVPTIILSSKDSKDGRLECMRNGADDYITKPFDNDELLVRMEVVIRRYQNATDASGGSLKYKELTINRNTFTAQLNHSPIILTKREFQILELLMSCPNKVFTKDNIYESVWNEEFMGEDNAVNVHVSNIRNKLAKINPDGKYIKTVWGIGFKME
jgi:DNA-binding response OmpR family regulator